MQSQSGSVGGGVATLASLTAAARDGAPDALLVE